MVRAVQSAYLNDPGKIFTHRAHEIGLDENNNITPYNDWHFSVKKTEKPELFSNRGGWCIISPHSLDDRCVDNTLFTQLTPHADDIWFWAMAKLKGTKYALIKNGYSYIESIDHSDGGLWMGKNEAWGTTGN